jgi:hypothetical protein
VVGLSCAIVVSVELDEGPALLLLLSGDPDEVNGHIMLYVAGIDGQQSEQRNPLRGKGSRRLAEGKITSRVEAATWLSPLLA